MVCRFFFFYFINTCTQYSFEKFSGNFSRGFLNILSTRIMWKSRLNGLEIPRNAYSDQQSKPGMVNREQKIVRLGRIGWTAQYSGDPSACRKTRLLQKSRNRNRFGDLSIRISNHTIVGRFVEASHWKHYASLHPKWRYFCFEKNFCTRSFWKNPRT